MKLHILAVLLLAGVMGQAQSYKPAVKLAAGKQYTITETTKGNVSQEVMGQTMDIPMDVTTTSTLLVKKVDGDATELSNTPNRLLLSMSAMGKDVNFDSDKKEDLDGEMGKAAGGMIGKETKFKVNKFGKLIEGSVIKPEGVADAAGLNPMMGMMNMGDGAQISSAVNLFSSDAEIKKGESFTDSSTSADGKEKKNFVYKLLNVENDNATFEITGKTSMTKEIEMQGMQMTTSMNTQITGNMVVNKTTGLLISKMQKSVIDGAVEVQGMSIPVTGENTVTITVTEKK